MVKFLTAARLRAEAEAQERERERIKKEEEELAEKRRAEAEVQRLREEAEAREKEEERRRAEEEKERARIALALATKLAAEKEYEALVKSKPQVSDCTSSSVSLTSSPQTTGISTSWGQSKAVIAIIALAIICAAIAGIYGAKPISVSQSKEISSAAEAHRFEPLHDVTHAPFVHASEPTSTSKSKGERVVHLELTEAEAAMVLELQANLFSSGERSANMPVRSSIGEIAARPLEAGSESVALPVSDGSWNTFHLSLRNSFLRALSLPIEVIGKFVRWVFRIR